MKLNVLVSLATLSLVAAAPALDIHIHSGGERGARLSQMSNKKLASTSDICLRVCWLETQTCPNGWVIDILRSSFIYTS